MVNRVQAIWQQRSSHRLGHYYEMLWQALIESTPATDLLACDFQLNAEGKTLGALDFLLWDSNNQRYTHLEVAVKFYLLAGNYDDPMAWIGPNAKDRLGRKLQHMRQTQSQLLAGANARDLLNKTLIKPPLPALDNDNLETQLMIQGWLFTQAAAETSVTHSHMGHWCRLSALPALCAFLPDNLLWLPKYHWISGARPEASAVQQSSSVNTIPLSPMAIKTQTVSHWHYQHPGAHLYQYTQDNKVQRLFIVPDSWPSPDHADFCETPSRKM